jgi:NADH-quinone oxidoreductase subunit N
MFYLFVYLFTTMGTFAMIILLSHRGFRSDKIADFAGLVYTHPVPATMYIVFFLSLAGIPPTAGFVGKLVVFRAAIASGFIGLAIIGVITSAIAAYYYFMVIKTMFMDAAPGEVDLSPSCPLAIAMFVMVLATVLLGLFPNLVLDFATASVRTFL